MDVTRLLKGLNLAGAAYNSLQYNGQQFDAAAAVRERLVVDYEDEYNMLAREAAFTGVVKGFDVSIKYLEYALDKLKQGRELVAEATKEDEDEEVPNA